MNYSHFSPDICYGEIICNIYLVEDHLLNTKFDGNTSDKQIDKTAHMVTEGEKAMELRRQGKLITRMRGKDQEGPGSKNC